MFGQVAAQAGPEQIALIVGPASGNRHDVIYRQNARLQAVTARIVAHRKCTFQRVRVYRACRLTSKLPRFFRFVGTTLALSVRIYRMTALPIGIASCFIGGLFYCPPDVAKTTFCVLTG